MAITNGYATLNDLKERLLKDTVYTSTGISFDSATKTIADANHGLAAYQANEIIQVTGSTSNDGYYTITTGNTTNAIVVAESLTDEAAGDSVTVATAKFKTEDSMLEQVIEAASRWIDNQTGRWFYSLIDTREYTAKLWDELYLDDDLLSVTAFKTDDDADRTYGTTWAVTDYDLRPFNRTPKTWVTLPHNGAQVFPKDVPAGVQIAGSFGYSATAPADVTQACILLASRFYMRKDAVFGVLGATALREIQLQMPRDPDVLSLIAPYVKRVLA